MPFGLRSFHHLHLLIMNNFPDFITAVQQFNRELLGVQQTGIRLLTDKERDYTHHCLVEEADEMRDAGQVDNIPKQVDAFVDSIYFALGGLYRMGLTPKQVLEACFLVHEANMTKKKGVNERRDMGVEDVIKPASFVPPEEAIAKMLGLI